MEKLSEKLNKLKKSSKYDLTDSFLEDLYSVYPFNKFEYVISHLLAEKIISLQDYLDIREEYITRNKYLHLFEIAPRSFGQTWGEPHLNELVQELQKPTSKLDTNWKGEYDFWYKGIKIEVKASRFVHKKSGGLLMEKALLSDSKLPFLMNFQQLKPKCCDVFVFIAVSRDTIKYWVLSSNEVETNKYISSQHRDGIEQQIMITNKNIDEFDKYLVEPRNLLKAIVKKAKSR